MRFSWLLLTTLAFCAPNSQTALQAAPSREPNFDALAKEATERLGEYLRLRTENPPGNEMLGAKWLSVILQKEGIASEIFEAAPGRANLYARLKGSGKKRPLILANHIDVVPASMQGWTTDPWAGAVRDGYVWGRGALDMKGEGVVQLLTMIALKRQGVPLSRDIIFLANADEENGGDFGAQWFAREKAALIKDAEFLINEGTSSRLEDDGRRSYYVGVTEKAPFWLRLTAKGEPGHGSRPSPNNPVARLGKALGKVASYEPPMQVTPAADRFFKDVAAREKDPEHKKWMENPQAFANDAKAKEFFASNLQYNAMLRNTISPTVVHASEKTNVIPKEASADLDVRLLPGVDPNAFLEEVRKLVDDPAIEITRILTPDRRSTSSPVDSALVRAVRETVGQMDPGQLVTTPLVTGYNDSGWYRALGIHAYDLEPFVLSQAEAKGIHGDNERVSLKNIRFGVEYFYRIVERIAR
jgi:acetylornithine deacetylase/succinyl-diaminopimelate desuccinylase-like protein